MPNEPGKAREKRDVPKERKNAQDDHEGSAHTPDEFDVMNPARQKSGSKPQTAPKPPAKDR